MSSRYFNPFQGLDVRVPNHFREAFGRYCQTHSEDGGKSSLLHSPFPRMVDMWFLAVCLGAQAGKPADYELKDTYKIIDASILSTDPWRIDALVLLAIGHTNSVDVIRQPRDVLAIASGFAVAGLDRLLEMLTDGDSEPVWNLSDELDRLLKELGGIQSVSVSPSPG
jgi:hypothetical protein